MGRTYWCHLLIAGVLLLTVGQQPGAGQSTTSAPPAGTGTEQRLRDLELQNQQLSRQLEQLTQQLQRVATRLDETARPAPSVAPQAAAATREPLPFPVEVSFAAGVLPLNGSPARAARGGSLIDLVPNWDLLKDPPPSIFDPNLLLVQERELSPIQPGQLGRPVGPGLESGGLLVPPAGVPPPALVAGPSPAERRIDYIQPNQLGRPLPPGAEAMGEPEGLERSRVDLTNGVSFRSPDGTYRIEFHNLTQVDFRTFSPTGKNMDPNDLVDGFVIPRERLYFTGDVGENFTFYSVLNRGYGALDVLDAYIDTKIAPWFNVRVGRTKTPYTYEYYKISEGDLIAPERSLFIGNLAGNREEGIMAWGRFLNERLEYALGLFNGPHRSFTTTNDAKSPFLFLNYRPFLLGASDELRYLAFGSSMNYWRAGGRSPVQPEFLSTMNDQSTSATVLNVSPTFLKYNPAAVLNGDMLFWSASSIWFLHSLFLMGEYNGGYETYGGLAREPRRGIVVPYSGWSLTTSYFLTGEQPVTRKEIIPLRDLRFADIWNHPGAFEVFARVEDLHASNSIFAFGLSDPKLWANDCKCLDLGFNWYWNRYLKTTFDWQLAVFNRPVLLATDRFTNSVDTFLLRMQLFY